MGSYAPFDNATLTFQVYSSYVTDPTTGNRVQQNQPQTDVCNVQLNSKFTENNEGVNEIETSCSGKLLNPPTFSSKIKAGMIAEAVINGVTGKLRVTDLGSNTLTYARASQFQNFTGQFEQTGAAG